MFFVFLCIHHIQKQIVMKSITIYPENEKQKSLLTSLLEEMKIRFEEESETLSEQQKQAIDQALLSVEKGEVISHDLVMQKTKEKYAKYFQ